MEMLRVSAVLIRECGQQRAKDKIIRGKFDFDVRGHYPRPDVFKLIVDERAKPAVEVER